MYSDYTYNNGQITKSQEGLSNGFFEMNLGAKLNYQLCQTYSIGMAYNYNHGISPIFKENDFSSMTRNHSTGFFLAESSPLPRY